MARSTATTLSVSVAGPRSHDVRERNDGGADGVGHGRDLLSKLSST